MSILLSAAAPMASTWLSSRRPASGRHRGSHGPAGRRRSPTPRSPATPHRHLDDGHDARVPIPGSARPFTTVSNLSTTAPRAARLTRVREKSWAAAALSRRDRLSCQGTEDRTWPTLVGPGSIPHRLRDPALAHRGTSVAASPSSRRSRIATLPCALSAATSAHGPGLARASGSRMSCQMALKVSGHSPPKITRKIASCLSGVLCHNLLQFAYAQPVRVLAMVRGQGRLPTRLAMRWTSPPSSSVMTSTGTPLAAVRRSVARSAGRSGANPSRTG
jgi:hypothetical protein